MKAIKINIKAISGKWKIAILAVVLLLIIGAIVYSVLSRDSNVLKAETNGNRLSNGTDVASNVPFLPEIGDLNWVKNLNDSFNDNDFVFIFVEGNDDGSNKKAENEIDSASVKIQTQGVKVAHISIDKQNPEYSATVSRMSSIQLPMVLEVNRNGNGLIIPGDITETRILQAYLTLAKACTPGSSCCP